MLVQLNYIYTLRDLEFKQGIFNGFEADISEFKKIGIALSIMDNDPAYIIVVFGNPDDDFGYIGVPNLRNQLQLAVVVCIVCIAMD